MKYIFELLSRLFQRDGGAFGGAGATGTFDTQEDRNEVAFLEMIPACEGTSYPDGWRALFGWRPGRTDRLFVLGPDHPRIKFHLNGDPFVEGEIPVAWQYTTAAGRFQLTESTYDRLCKSYGYRGMSEADQRRSAIDLIREAGALQLVRSGQVVKAIERLGRIWASLPSSTSGHPKRSWDFAVNAYKAHGGVIA